MAMPGRIERQGGGSHVIAVWVSDPSSARDGEHIEASSQQVDPDSKRSSAVDSMDIGHYIVVCHVPGQSRIIWGHIDDEAGCSRLGTSTGMLLSGVEVDN